MNDTSKRLADPLIDEVRERRRQLSLQHGNDLAELYKAIKELQEQHPQKVLRPQKK